MNKIVTLIRDLVLIAIVLVIVVQWQERNLSDDDGTIEVPKQSLVSLTGQVSTLANPGERTLVYFFAPWCSVCELSINSLEGIEADNLRVVRVALDYQTRNEVVDFVTRNAVEGEVLLGTQEQKGVFNVPGYPTYYILDEQRRIVGHSFGLSTNWGIRLKNYLSQSES